MASMKHIGPGPRCGGSGCSAASKAAKYRKRQRLRARSSFVAIRMQRSVSLSVDDIPSDDRGRAGCWRDRSSRRRVLPRIEDKLRAAGRAEVGPGENASSPHSPRPDPRKDCGFTIARGQFRRPPLRSVGTNCGRHPPPIDRAPRPVNPLRGNS